MLGLTIRKALSLTRNERTSSLHDHNEGRMNLTIQICLHLLPSLSILHPCTAILTLITFCFSPHFASISVIPRNPKILSPAAPSPFQIMKHKMEIRIKSHRLKEKIAEEAKNEVTHCRSFHVHSNPVEPPPGLHCIS